MKTGSPQSATGGKGYQFGTAPVFLASISTILGAIMILRFGYAVAHTGLAGALWIIVLGHLVTFPTAMAIAEIATNRRVEGDQQRRDRHFSGKFARRQTCRSDQVRRRRPVPGQRVGKKPHGSGPGLE